MWQAGRRAGRRDSPVRCRKPPRGPAHSTPRCPARQSRQVQPARLPAGPRCCSLVAARPGVPPGCCSSLQHEGEARGGAYGEGGVIIGWQLRLRDQNTVTPAATAVGGGTEQRQQQTAGHMPEPVLPTTATSCPRGTARRRSGRRKLPGPAVLPGAGPLAATADSAADAAQERSAQSKSAPATSTIRASPAGAAPAAPAAAPTRPEDAAAVSAAACRCQGLGGSGSARKSPMRCTATAISAVSSICRQTGGRAGQARW